jgi:hypothetical protein
VSIDPIRPIRVQPALGVRPVRDRDRDGRREPDDRRREDDAGDADRRDDEPDDGLPHVDVRAFLGLRRHVRPALG